MALKVTASKSALLLSPCVRWAWEGAKHYEDEYADTTKRDKGVAFHALMDDYYKLITNEPSEHTGQDVIETPYCTSPDVLMWHRLTVQWSIDFLEPRCNRIRSEVYTAYNFTTDKSYQDPTVCNRGYPTESCFDGYIHGTADIVAELSNGKLLIADWKTGGGTGAPEQLMTLACSLSKPTDQVTLAILYVSEKGVRPVVWDCSQEELAAHKERMRSQLDQVGKNTTPVQGIHCTQLYCGHLAYCPGPTLTVEASSEGPEGLIPVSRLKRSYAIQEAPTSKEHAGYIMERVTAAKRQIDFYEKRIRKYVSDGGKCIAGDFEFSKGNDGFRWRKVSK